MFHVSGILHCTFPMSFITTDFIAYDKNIAYEEAIISNWMWGMEGVYLGKKKKNFCSVKFSLCTAAGIAFLRQSPYKFLTS